jgi:nucleotide exchange factor SIL1
MVILRESRILLLSFVAIISVAAAAIPQEETICAPTDPTDCYPLMFKPSKKWQIVREGQQIPIGLDIRLDMESRVKSAKLSDAVESREAQAVVVSRPVEEVDENKVVNYSGDEHDDEELKNLRKAYEDFDESMELESALDFIKKGELTDTKTIMEALEALSEYSHGLKNGVTISEPNVMINLLDLATKDKYTASVRELALRVIAQSLRYNPEALANVNAISLFPRLLRELETEKNSLLQKRVLGVISTVIQSSENTSMFIKIGGEDKLLSLFSKFNADSKVRLLDILDDLNNHRLFKRSDDDGFTENLFKEIQKALSEGGIDDDHSLEAIFDKLVELKKSNKSFRTDPSFLEWLVNEVQDRKLNKRDGRDEELHKKMFEARHTVFGNPNALRKAYADEL